MKRASAGGTVLAIIIVIGIVAAIVAATMLISTSQSLGRSSQQGAQAATMASGLQLDSAHAHVESGRVVEVQLLVRHTLGAPVPMSDLLVTLDTGQGIWLADVTWDALRDSDGSLATGSLGPGDLVLLTMPIDTPFSTPASHAVSVHAGEELVGEATLHWPVAGSRIITARVG